jgi:hypothetical protein
LLFVEILIHSATAWLLTVASNKIRIALENKCPELYIYKDYQLWSNFHHKNSQLYIVNIYPDILAARTSTRSIPGGSVSSSPALAIKAAAIGLVRCAFHLSSSVKASNIPKADGPSCKANQTGVSIS